MVRKGYKNTEIGEIPQDWNLEKLSEIISEPIINGAFIAKDSTGHAVPFINVTDIYQNVVVQTNKLPMV